jgi:hypothetical protein
MNELNVVTLLIEHMFYCRRPIPQPRAPLAEPGAALAHHRAGVSLNPAESQ